MADRWFGLWPKSPEVIILDDSPPAKDIIVIEDDTGTLFARKIQIKLRKLIQAAD